MIEIKDVALFISGGIVGAGLTYILMKRNENLYEEIVEIENDGIDDLVDDSINEETQNSEECVNIIEELDEIIEEDPIIVQKETKKKMKDIIEEEQYGEIEEEKPNPILIKTPEALYPDKPYIITSEEFLDFPDYDKISLYFFSDGVLMNDDEEIFVIDEIIGNANANEILKSDMKFNYVRDDKKECDYEVEYIEETYLGWTDRHYKREE